MPIRSLYLSIYVTVVAVLLVFALVAGLLLRGQAENERRNIETAIAERVTALGGVIGQALPPVAAPDEQQAQVLAESAQRMRMALALDAPDGRRIATTAGFEQDRQRTEGLGPPVSRVTLADGRVLWVARPHGPWERRRGAHRPPGPWGGPLWRLLDEALVLLAVLFVAIAAGSYPVVRRLTRRLETLRQGVETFGAGALDYRVQVQGRDEVSAVAASFNQAAQRVEDLVRANRSLLANASHELRSPLTRLKMAVSMLDAAGPDQREALRQEIHADIRELDVLVEEVLLASRLDAQAALHFDGVEVGSLVAEEAARVDALVEVQTAAVGLQVLGDERLLRRALRNLFENGRRYGGEQLEADVRVVSGQGTALLQVQVCDRGPGVPEAERERIFEPFYRLPGHSETAGGIGLGLSLVRQIAVRHGGTVCCQPRPGGGSCFVLSLPLPGSPSIHGSPAAADVVPRDQR